MTSSVHDVQIKQVRDHWVVYVNGKFFCTADSYIEAVNELYETYK